jgi:orotate phosphoribosyltransferase-like protein
MQPHQSVLVDMRAKGFSYQQLADWLADKEIQVSKDTVRLFVERATEMKVSNE